MNGERAMIWKETAVAYLKIFSRDSPKGTKEYHENAQ
jgi:hypothetical protein